MEIELEPQFYALLSYAAKKYGNDCNIGKGCKVKIKKYEDEYVFTVSPPTFFEKDWKENIDTEEDNLIYILPVIWFDAGGLMKSWFMETIDFKFIKQRLENFFNKNEVEVEVIIK